MAENKLSSATTTPACGNVGVVELPLRNRQVRINHFNVGWVLTQRMSTNTKSGLPADWPDKIPSQFAPTGRIMKPLEIAAASVYWLTDERRPISGSVVDLEQYPFIGRNPTKRGE